MKKILNIPKPILYLAISGGLLLIALLLTIFANIFNQQEDTYYRGENYLYIAITIIAILVGYVGLCISSKDEKILLKCIPFISLVEILVIPAFFAGMTMGCSGFDYDNIGSLGGIILFFILTLIIIGFSFTKNVIAQKVVAILQMASLIYPLICCIFNINLDIGYRASGIQIPYAWILSCLSLSFIFLSIRELMLVDEVVKPIKSALISTETKLKEYGKRYNDGSITQEEYVSYKKETLMDYVNDNQKNKYSITKMIRSIVLFPVMCNYILILVLGRYRFYDYNSVEFLQTIITLIIVITLFVENFINFKNNKWREIFNKLIIISMGAIILQPIGNYIYSLTFYPSVPLIVIALFSIAAYLICMFFKKRSLSTLLLVLSIVILIVSKIILNIQIARNPENYYVNVVDYSYLIFLLCASHSVIRMETANIPFEFGSIKMAKKIYWMDFKLGYISKEEYYKLKNLY